MEGITCGDCESACFAMPCATRSALDADNLQPRTRWLSERKYAAPLRRVNSTALAIWQESSVRRRHDDRQHLVLAAGPGVLEPIGAAQPSPGAKRGADQRHEQCDDDAVERSREHRQSNS